MKRGERGTQNDLGNLGNARNTFVAHRGNAEVKKDGVNVRERERERKGEKRRGARKVYAARGGWWVDILPEVLLFDFITTSRSRWFDLTENRLSHASGMRTCYGSHTWARVSFV